MNIECRRYLREIRLAFPVFQKAEHRFFNDFRASIKEYENIDDNVTRDTLYIKFGLPKDVVAEYFNSMGASSYMKLMRKTMYMKILIFIITIFLIVSFIFHTYSINQMRKEVRDTKIVLECEEIDYIIE